MGNYSEENTELLPVHPRPGARPARAIWIGEDGAGPVEETNPDVRPFSQSSAVQFSEVVQAYQGRHSARATSVGSQKSAIKTRPKQSRLLGVDVARGIAFLGMVVIHILPISDESTGEPTPIWTIFSGNAAALFALLAGISLAFMTGGSRPYTGDKRMRALVSITARSALLMVIGMSINMVGDASGVFNILPYYGLMFLIAIPLTMMPVRWLLIAAIGFAAIGPFLVYPAYERLGDGYTGNPTLVELVQRPQDVFNVLVFTGAYPVVTWALYVCVGIAIGRLSLHRERTQLALVFVGGIVAVFSKITAYILLMRQGGIEAIFNATDGLTQEEFSDLRIFGPSDYFPTTTYWWLTVDAPHSNTPFAMTFSLGIAMLALGLVLLLSKYLMSWLAVFSNMGSMTLTLYSAHLVSVNLVNINHEPMMWFLITIFVAAAFAMLWANVFGNGPLERVVSRISKAVGRAVIPDSRSRKNGTRSPHAAK